jgi:hypothetical protein
MVGKAASMDAKIGRDAATVGATHSMYGGRTNVKAESVGRSDAR